MGGARRREDRVTNAGARGLVGMLLLPSSQVIFRLNFVFSWSNIFEVSKVMCHALGCH